MLKWETGTKSQGVHVNVDCGVCHNPSYDFSKRYFNTAHNKWDYNLADQTAQRNWKISGSASFANEVCYRCHKTSFEWKRGTPFLQDAAGNQDVHVSKGLHCLSCHTVETVKVKNDCTSCHTKINHKIARGKDHLDNSVNDLPDVVVDCSNCHNFLRHTALDGSKQWVGNHARLACQACHTPKQDSNVVYRRFRDPDPTNYDPGNFYQIVISDIYPFQQVTFTDAETTAQYTTVPYQFVWFDGTQDAIGKPVFSTRSNNAARLTPVKYLYSIFPGNQPINGWFQMSHGTRPKTQALRDCNFCHQTHADKLGL
jgi:hypothetical protein